MEMIVDDDQEFVKFVLIVKKPRTDVYGVYNTQKTIKLGEIRWFAQWRRYAFYPNANTVFDAACLSVIRDFIHQLMEERKQHG
jgi:hypothetical protein